MKSHVTRVEKYLSRSMKGRRELSRIRKSLISLKSDSVRDKATQLSKQWEMRSEVINQYGLKDQSDDRVGKKGLECFKIRWDGQKDLFKLVVLNRMQLKGSEKGCQALRYILEICKSYREIEWAWNIVEGLSDWANQQLTDIEQSDK